MIDYKTAEGEKYDAVIHCSNEFPWSIFETNLSMNGKVVDLSPTLGSVMNFALKKLTFPKKQLVPLLLLPKGGDIQYLVDLVKQGKIRTVIDSK